MSKLHESRVTHVIWVILDVESNGNGDLTFNLKVRSKRVKNGPFSKYKIMTIKHFSDSFSSQESNGVICFCV